MLRNVLHFTATLMDTFKKTLTLSDELLIGLINIIHILYQLALPPRQWHQKIIGDRCISQVTTLNYTQKVNRKKDPIIKV